jgi:hypothetical protein
MPNKDKRSATTKDSTDTSAKETRSTGATRNAAESHAQKVIDQEQSQGFRGVEVDPTPNENYTVAGVTSGAPTPETDVDSAKDVRGSTGLGLSALEAADREKTQRGEN